MSLGLLADYSRYLQVPYLDKGRSPEGWDCWGLVYWISRHHLRRMVPSYADEYGSAETDAGVTKAILENSPLWHSVTARSHEGGDVVVFNLAGNPVHCGFILRAGEMLHCMKGRNTCRESYLIAAWSQRIEGVYRWIF